MSETKENVLFVLFEEEPQLEKLGDKVLSSEKCNNCNEYCVYNGPTVKFVEVGRCLVCGELQ